MAVGNKVGEKSRRDRRKEGRLQKKRKKFDSWIENQNHRKLKKVLEDSDPKKVMKVKTSSIQSLKEREDLHADIDSESDHSSEQQARLKKSKLKLDSSQSASKAIGGRKGSKKNSKSKFEEYLKMEMQQGVITAEEDFEMERKLAKKLKVKDGKLRGVDHISMLVEGIPSVDNFFEEERNPVFEEIVEKTSEKKSSSKKRKKSTLEKGLEGAGDVAGEAVVGLSKPDETCYEIDQSIPQAIKPKKLKTKQDSPQNSEAATVKTVKGKNIETLERKPPADMAGDAVVEASEPVETIPAKGARKRVPAKTPELDGSAKYVAPHLRSLKRNEPEEYSQIRRRIRGLLNRLAESNVESTTAEVSSIFRTVPRSVGSEMITEEVLASCSGGPRGNEQYAAVFAAFVAGMASLVGIDFGAKLLASLAKCFEDEYLEEDNLSLRNLALLLSYLYVFGVCSSDLLYDFMILLSKRLTEIDVATILAILQCCGMNLRGENHAAMKIFVLSVQNRATELKASSGNGQPNTSSKRMEFMLETINEIKNNKKRETEDTPQHTRIKKWLQKLRVDDISISGLKWSTLLDPDKKGQWWLSGDLVSKTNNIEEVARTTDMESLEAQKLLQLAGAQRMNTDVRKAIFCVIMSGEDYIDAFEKILRLNLQGKQDREIMRVLVECCLQEQVYNKYYAVLATKLCSHDKNHKESLKYCLWDHFKELESMQLKRSMHLSKFIVEMLTSFNLSLSVLKVVDFSDTTKMIPKRIKHFQMLFEAIFEHPDSLVWNVFVRIATLPDCESLRHGITFFVNKYVVSSENSFAHKFKIVKKAFASVEGALMGV